MSQKKYRDRVMAEITLSHLLRLANEQGRPVSREQALVFLNQEGRAYEMWKYMMQAGEDFIARTLLRQRIKNHVLRTTAILRRTFGWLRRARDLNHLGSLKT
jgi:hypothetical protein